MFSWWRIGSLVRQWRALIEHRKGAHIFFSYDGETATYRSSRAMNFLDQSEATRYLVSFSYFLVVYSFSQPLFLPLSLNQPPRTEHSLSRDIKFSIMSDRAEAITKYSKHLATLSHLYRRGWLLKGIPNPESVAAHSHRMACFAALLDPIPGCDMNKVIRMCLFHDNAESM